MNTLGFRPDTKIIDFIQTGQFTLSAEVIPPRNGTEQTKVLNQIQSLVECGAQFLSVTKGAGGSLRGGSLPIAQAVKDQFKVPCIAHFTCRDITPQDVENQLIDHHYFGIRNILALRGDPPMDQPEWKPNEGSHSFAYQLIEQIRKMNAGEFIPRPGGPKVEGGEKTDFCIGAAAYPEHPDLEERFRFFKLKVEAGAEYGITQMVFDVAAYSEFLELCEKNNLKVPILPGTRLLKSQKQARNMANRFGVSVPETLLKKLPEKASSETLNQTVDVFLEFLEDLKKAGAPGVHLFVLSDTEGSCRVLKRLRKS